MKVTLLPQPDSADQPPAFAPLGDGKIDRSTAMGGGGRSSP